MRNNNLNRDKALVNRHKRGQVKVVTMKITSKVLGKLHSARNTLRGKILVDFAPVKDG
jgi:hypothetical protein